MAFSDWSTTAGSNTSVGGVSIAEGMNPSDVNNAIRAVMAEAKAALSTTPVGTVVAYAGTTEPSGWLFCYGQAVSQATYAALYAVLGTTYGSDAGGNFTLPDLRGRVVAGQDDMGGSSANRLTNQTGGLNGDTLGATGGAETHTLTATQMPAHTHTMGGSYSTYGVFGGGSVVLTQVSDGNTGSAGSDGAHNNVQPTIILNYIIKV